MLTYRKFHARRTFRLAAFSFLVVLIFSFGGAVFADPFAFPGRETFGAPVSASAGIGSALALGDLNQDGLLDLVVGHENSLPSKETPGYVFLSDEAGTFHVGPVVCGETAQVSCFGDSGDSVSSLALGDIDDDGDLDIVAGYSDPGVRDKVFFNEGSGVFGPGVSFGQIGLFTTALILADLDGSNGLDLAVGARDGQNTVYLNDGTGSFAASAPFGTGSDRTLSLAIGDVDGANGPDIVAGNNGGQSVLYLNNGAGEFAAGTISCGVTGGTRCIGGASEPTSGVALGRLDADSDLDLIVIRAEASNQRYLNDGAGNVGSAAAFGSASGDSRTLATGDFDRDGDLDVAIGEADRVNELYINDGSGNLSLLASFGSATTPAALRSGDVNSDGALDLLVINGGLQSEIYLNSGAGSFAESDAVAFGGFAAPALKVATGDLNQDGTLDIVMLRQTAQARIIFLDAAGNPSETVPFGEPSPRYQDLALGDMDGDGDLDIVLASPGDQNLVFFNQDIGSGTFVDGPIICNMAGVACFGSGDDPTNSVTLADINGDGPLDIVAGNGSTALSAVYFNQGNTFFRGRLRCDGSEVPAVACLGEPDITTSSIAAGDLDGDGDPDVALGNDGWANQVYLNEGGTTFIAGSTFGSGSDSTRALSMGDLNGDGRFDIVVGNSRDQSAVLFNQGEARFATNPALCRLGEGVACFGSGLDQTRALALGDMDNDGDLDILAGQSGGQSAVYVNNGDGQFLSRRSFAGASAQISSLATGDLDNDGDQDLVAGRTDQASQIYRNARAGVDLAAFAEPQLTVLTPGPVAQPAGIAATEILTAPVISISYRLNAPVAYVAGEYSIDGGGIWRPAITSAGQPGVAAPQPESGGLYSYAWDTFASGFFGQSDAVVFRLKAYPATSSFPGAAAGSYQEPYVAAQSYSFRARGTQVQVIDSSGQAVEGAIVYQLAQGKNSEALPMASAPADPPFTTSSEGYLRGRGALAAGDQLMAFAPILATTSYTLYHTSAPVTLDGPQLQAVSEPGVQTLTVSADNPLLLFNLDVALEWDARSDTAFLTRLTDDLERASAVLYDWSDGQIALGDITLFHDAKQRRYFPDPTSNTGWDLWSFANVRIYSTNRLRPNADKGGVVITDTLDPDKPENEPYRIGQVRMPASWNRFGNSAGEIGEDWPRTLAHELGHYLLFLEDNYLGLAASESEEAESEESERREVLIPVAGCLGAMADPYRDDYSEFHPRDAAWEANCQLTLSEREAGRADWQTITRLYPQAGLRAPTSYDANPGPVVLPLAVTRVSEAPLDDDPVALAAPFFSLEDEAGAVTPGGSARAFLFHQDEVWLTDLGRPVADRLEARGATPGDEVCVFDPDANRQGCITVTTGNQALTLNPTPDWRPEVIVTPVNSTTLTVQVINQAAEPFAPASMQARVYPIDRPAPAAFTLLRRADGSYTETVTLDLPVFEGAVHIVGEPNSREALVDYALRGNPGRRWSSVAPRGDPGRRWSSVAPRNNPGRRWSSVAPVISGDGQAIIYTDDDFAEGEFMVVQSAAEPPAIPAWATRVGQVYRVTATPNAPALDDSSISIGYLGRDVPDGAEPWLGLYHWDGSEWQALQEIEENPEVNLLAASMRGYGPGLYAILAAVPAADFASAGWHSFGYPLADDQPVETAMASLAGRYSLLYEDAGRNENPRWKLYAPGAPGYISDLTHLTFNRRYEVYLTDAGTLLLNPQPQRQARPQQGDSAPLPAAFYGRLADDETFQPVADSEVWAYVGSPAGPVCGRGTILEHEGDIVYRVLVEAAGNMANCGTPGASVYLSIAGEPFGPVGTWDNTRLTELNLAPGGLPVYLPFIAR